jgi:hypothetical protein
VEERILPRRYLRKPFLCTRYSLAPCGRGLGRGVNRVIRAATLGKMGTELFSQHFYFSESIPTAPHPSLPIKPRIIPRPAPERTPERSGIRKPHCQRDFINTHLRLLQIFQRDIFSHTVFYGAGFERRSRDCARCSPSTAFPASVK